MSIIAYLELSSIDPHQLPDHRAEPSDYFDLDRNFVISRTKDGNILSKYGENIWNLKTYDAKGRCVYNFSSWHSGEDTSIAREITEEMKKIQISRLFLYHKPRRPISITLIELRKFAKLALKIDLHSPNYLKSAICARSCSQVTHTLAQNKCFLP